MAAMATNEMQWVKVYAKPRINAYRSIETPETPDEYISLLERFLQLIRYLSPGPCRTSLSHPDLHRDNIFVDPATKKISCIIDCQSASVSEPFFQHNIPRMLLPVGSRLARNALEESNGSKESNETADLLSHYEKLTRLGNGQRWDAPNSPNHLLLAELVSLLCGAWSRNDVFSFRHALIHVAATWHKVAQSTTPCPINFTEKELELHGSELETVEGLGEVLHQLDNDNLIPLGGMVLRENFEQALHVNKTVREMLVNMAKTESRRVLYSQAWPYQDPEP
jgi:Phosphotransferase enzyme family